MSNPRNKPKSDAEWYDLIMDCRKSGLSDAQWCKANDIATSTFSYAIKRLREKSYGIPERIDDDIHDLTQPKQDVVKVDIVPDVQPPVEYIPEVAPHIDNSHMIEIEIGGAKISLCNGADPELVSKTLMTLRRFA
jgi:hypothetical protein